ncbi:MAG: hypothetical protein K2X49_05755 [Acetobacteraceae bacterium]|nr:hypothetical protein [Acetobacteraceae bacterium]
MQAAIRIIATVLVAGFVGLGAAACSTVDGAGRDLSNSSRWVRDRL